MATVFCGIPGSAFVCPIKTGSIFSRNYPSPKSRVRFSLSCFREPEVDTLQAVEAFWLWLSDKGVVSPAKSSIKPELVQEGLGLVAQRDIGRNEVVLEVPKRFWINPDMVAASDIGPACSGLKPWVSMALFLVRERQKAADSLWSPYLDILPEFTNSPIFWWVFLYSDCIIFYGNSVQFLFVRVQLSYVSQFAYLLINRAVKLVMLSFQRRSEEELSQLQGSQLLNTTLGVKELVQNEFMKAEQEVILPNTRLFPSSIRMEEFIWAFGMLRSRAFTQLSRESIVLIPLADLINHSPDITSEGYAYEIKGAGLFSRDLLFSLRSPVPVKAGEQVLIQYDLNKTNAELALDYGFAESREDRNTYTLTLSIPESDPFYGDKLDVAEMNGLGETAYFDITLGQPLPPNMILYLRLLAIGGTDAFLLEALFRGQIWSHLELPLSRANEELVCQVMMDSCRSALSGYPTNIDEDEKLKRQGNLDPRFLLAVDIRLGEKKVLQHVVKIFSQRELELDSQEYYQERRLRQLGLACDEEDILFWETKK